MYLSLSNTEQVLLRVRSAEPAMPGPERQRYRLLARIGYAADTRQLNALVSRVVEATLALAPIGVSHFLRTDHARSVCTGFVRRNLGALDACCRAACAGRSHRPSWFYFARRLRTGRCESDHQAHWACAAACAEASYFRADGEYARGRALDRNTRDRAPRRVHSRKPTPKSLIDVVGDGRRKDTGSSSLEWICAAAGPGRRSSRRTRSVWRAVFTPKPAD